MWTPFKGRRLARGILESVDKTRLARRFPIFKLLDEHAKTILCAHTQELMAEKNFEGCSGLMVTREMRLLISAQAALLLVGRSENCYPVLRTVLLYPNSFVAPCHHTDELGIVSEGEEARTGESWKLGVVVLAWDEVLSSAQAAPGAFNVVLHEFAHQLDTAWGYIHRRGIIAVKPSEMAWAKVMNHEFQRLRRAVETGHESILNPYGAEHPAEFFAVATECFFQNPRKLQSRHPELYTAMQDFYGQNPAQWQWELLNA